jgi:hypothetical protein
MANFVSIMLHHESWARGLRRFTDDNGDTVVELKPGITVTRSFAKPASFKVEQSVISKAQPAKRKKTQDPIVPIEPERELSESHIGILRKIRSCAVPVKASIWQTLQWGVPHWEVSAMIATRYEKRASNYLAMLTLGRPRSRTAGWQELQQEHVQALRLI